MTIGPDLVLDPLSHDLAFGPDGDLQMEVSIRQQIKIRLMFFRGEWFLDETIGTPWFEDLLKKGFNLDHATAIFRDRILGTAGVTALTQLDLSYDSPTRKLGIRFRAETTLGNVEDIVEIQV